MDDVPIIDDMTALAFVDRPPTQQRHDWCRAEEAVQPVVVQMHPQTVADEPRRRGIEHPAQDEAAAGCDGDGLFLIIGCPAPGQGAKLRTLQLDPLAIVGIATSHDLVDETVIAIESIEVAAAAQEQGILKRLLQMTVRAFDRSILMCHAAVLRVGAIS